MWIHKLFQLCWPTYKLEVFQLPSRELTYPPKKWHFFEDDFPNFPFGGGICMLIPWEGNPVGDQPVDWVFKKKSLGIPNQEVLLILKIPFGFPMKIPRFFPINPTFPIDPNCESISYGYIKPTYKNWRFSNENP